MKLIVFDLDGTLTESKQLVDDETAELLSKLSEKYYVGIISGGPWKQFKKQLLSKTKFKRVENVLLLPTSGTSMRKWNGLWWSKLYENKINEKDKEIIISTIKVAMSEYHNYSWPRTGDLIEDRGSQITYSALGQKAPIYQKEMWAKNYYMTKKLMHEYIQEDLPMYDVRMGGSTSIDITYKGMDKAYGMKRLLGKFHGVVVNDVIFIGDRLEEGGNDYAVKKAGYPTVATKGPEQTKEIIRGLLTEQ